MLFSMVKKIRPLARSNVRQVHNTERPANAAPKSKDKEIAFRNSEFSEYVAQDLICELHH